jgi:hypothetical protein
MFNLWSVPKKHPKFRHLLLLSGILMAGLCQGQTSPNARLVNRMPASYIPDDDVIVKPVENELSFYQQYVASDNSSEVIRSRNQLRIWNENQIFAEQYGMDSKMAGSPYFVPTAEEKWEYFKDKYMRYLRRKGEKPFKDMPKTWYQEYRASNEVDTIDELEAKFQSSAKKTRTGNVLPDSLRAKEVSLWKKTRFIFQPRVDQGLVILGIKGPIAYARAWIGVNGKTEINVKKEIDSIGLRAMFNYETDNGRYFSSFDQRVSDNLYARLTASKDPANNVQDETLMLLYAKQF